MTRRRLCAAPPVELWRLHRPLTIYFGQPAPGPPNIVFIMADDLGYADVSCYGRPDISTPNIDGLAAKGMRFLQAYANSAVCSATRTALITGRYQYRLPIGLEEPLAGRDVGLPPDHPTLPSSVEEGRLRNHASRKVASGIAPEIRASAKRVRSFLRIPRRRCRLLYARYNQKDDLWDDDVQVHQMGYLTDLLGSRAVDVVNGYAKAGRPFLMSLHFNAPHWPWEAPGDEAESNRLRSARSLLDFDGGTQEDLPAHGSGNGSADRPRA